jgi:hypothetical protein
VVYLDGEVAASLQVIGKRIAGTENPVWLACHGYRTYFQGLIDEVQIWNIALSQEGIRESVRAGIKGDEPGLAGYWNFEEGKADDRSPNENHGTLEGSAEISLTDTPAAQGPSPGENVLVPSAVDRR